MPSLLPLLTLLVLARSGLCDSRHAHKACNSLSSVLKNKIHLPGTEGYNKSISSYAYAESQLRPTCMVGPSKTEDIQKAIKILGQYKKVNFAVRSGGHGVNKGMASVEDGVVIDLTAMNQVNLNYGQDIVSIGAGNRWQNVYHTLELHGLSVQGGRVGDVGVGGLITGGGIGYFSLEKGFACDSVTNFEVVLSDGTVVNANATSNKDLFTGLKGGQNNFGIVTRFDLRTIPQKDLWGGVVIYANTTESKLLKTYTAFKTPEKFDPYAMLFLVFLHNTTSNESLITGSLYHTRPDKVKGTTMEDFTRIKPQLYNTMRLAPPASFADELIDTTQGLYQHWSTLTFAISPTILFRIHETWKNETEVLKSNYAAAGLVTSLVIQSVPSAAPPSNPNSLGFPPNSHPEHNLINLLLMLRYRDPAATAHLEHAAKQLTAKFEKIAKHEGVLNRYMYLNYAASWQDVLKGYGRESVEKMRRVAKKYDGRGMFQKQVRGGWKLFG